MNRSILAVITIALAACAPEGSGDSTVATVASTTTTAPTTTTVDPAALAADTCDDLKVAVFDLDSQMSSAFADLGAGSDQGIALDDAEIGRLVVESLVAFFDTVDEIADEAPADIVDHLRTVSDGVEPWRVALAGPDDGIAAALEDLDPASITTPEVEAALEELTRWTEEMCGTPIVLDAEEILFTTVFAAMFGAMGDAFGNLEDAFANGFDEPGNGGQTGQPDLLAVAYGDDPELDDLYERCGTGDGEACSDLYYTGFGEYELWGVTCGATIPLRTAYLVDCAGKFGGDGGAYGDDFVLDSLWDSCESGDTESCDGLFAASPFGTPYEQFGATCGNTRPPGDATRPCTFEVSGQPYGYGDDAELDTLWDTCSIGDADACSELFLVTPIASVYEAFGRTCGDLVEAGKPCDSVADWLGEPVG